MPVIAFAKLAVPTVDTRLLDREVFRAAKQTVAA
jgi:hypothetical protein